MHAALLEREECQGHREMCIPHSNKSLARVFATGKLRLAAATGRSTSAASAASLTALSSQAAADPGTCPRFKMAVSQSSKRLDAFEHLVERLIQLAMLSDPAPENGLKV